MNVPKYFYSKQQISSEMFSFGVIRGNICRYFLGDLNCETFQKSLTEKNIQFEIKDKGILYDGFLTDTVLSNTSFYLKNQIPKYIRSIEYMKGGSDNKDNTVSTTIDDLIEKIQIFDESEKTWLPKYKIKQLTVESDEVIKDYCKQYNIGLCGEYSEEYINAQNNKNAAIAAAIKEAQEKQEHYVEDVVERQRRRQQLLDNPPDKDNSLRELSEFKILLYHGGCRR